ncbi:MAG: segregation and condensation protein A [Fusobacteriota bacterium]
MKFKIKLDNFEGPLDLLLHLIEEEEMDIYQINISKIIENYLGLINQAKESNINIKLEFLIMASELLDIKFHRLLNKKSKEKEEELLQEKLRIYKKYKEIANDLYTMQNEYYISYKKDGKAIENHDNDSYDFSNITPNRLFQYYNEIIQNNNEKSKRMIINTKENFTIEDGKRYLFKKLNINSKIDVKDLLNKKDSKIKIISIFLAILDYYKDDTIDIKDENQHIYVCYKGRVV